MTGWAFSASWWQGRLDQALSRRRLRRQGLEATLDGLADRLARAELALFQERRRHQQAIQRAQAAEQDVHRLQVLLERQRDRRLDRYS